MKLFSAKADTIKGSSHFVSIDSKKWAHGGAVRGFCEERVPMCTKRGLHGVHGATW